MPGKAASDLCRSVQGAGLETGLSSGSADKICNITKYWQLCRKEPYYEDNIGSIGRIFRRVYPGQDYGRKV